MGILFFIWYTGRDSNPQPSEPESDALSIEPPVRLIRPDYYSRIPPVCKGGFCNILEYLNNYKCPNNNRYQQQTESNNLFPVGLGAQQLKPKYRH